MDTTEAVTHVSLCAGYGGIDLGLKRAVPNLRTIAFSEIEAFACANLVGKMEAGLLDAAPIWTDLKTFPWDSFHGKVHILSGGYPCQPFSAAGLRRGAEDPRHLWPFIADGIGRMRPELCFFENVEGHVSLGLREVIGELESLGYRATWGLFSAAEVGAPHQRKRVFIMAHRKNSGLEGYWRLEQGELRHDSWPSRPSQPQFAWEPPRVVGQQSNAMGNPQSESKRGLSIRKTKGESRFECSSNADAVMGHADSGRQSSGLNAGGGGQTSIGGQGDVKSSECGQTQPSLGGDTDGAAGGLYYAKLCRACDNRTDELRLLGNGVVPATAERAFRVLAGRLFQ